MNDDWMSEARCRNYKPEMFFPSDSLGVDAACRICETCPVAEACLEFAIENQIDHGIWGGASERSRKRIGRARRRAEREAAASLPS